MGSGGSKAKQAPAGDGTNDENADPATSAGGKNGPGPGNSPEAPEPPSVSDVLNRRKPKKLGMLDALGGPGAKPDDDSVGPNGPKKASLDGPDTVQSTRKNEDGKFEMTYRTGGRYIGAIHDRTRQGDGTMEYQDGDTYIGQWEKDTKQGQGRMEYKNGNVYTGTWNKGEPNGEGVMEFDDGKRYEGDFSDGWCTGT